MKRVAFTFALGGLLGLTLASAQPVIDNTETRVQTTLEPGFKRIGTLTPRSAGEISGQNWWLGCETLDRGFTSYDSYKEYIVPLGIRRIRLQGGWATTEREKGKYDFRWLDRVIDDARGRGLEIFLETSYGNPIYPDGGGRGLSGGFPKSEEALAAMDKWVETMAKRYQGKIRDWGMWNEPDGNKQHTPEMTADINVRTAEIIKRIIPDARIAGAVLCGPKSDWTEGWLKRVTELKKESLFYWFAYHAYTRNPDEGHYEDVEKVRTLVQQYAPHLRLWQAEAGTQSEFCLGGALKKYPWTELTQAKWQVRRMLGDLGHGAESLVFSIADLDYNRWEGYRLGDMDRYGLVKTDKQYRILKVKIAYYAVQNVVSVFDDQLELVPEFQCEIKAEKSTACYPYKHKQSGTHVLAFWDKSDVPSNQNQTIPASFTFPKGSFKNPVWVDTITGGIYAVPAKSILSEGDQVTLKDIPVYDAPALITDEALVLKRN